MGVSTGTIVGWEAGKFKPRGKKVAELSNLDKWDKKDVRTKLAEQESKPADTTPKRTPVKKAARLKSKGREKRVEGKTSEALSTEKPPEPEKTEEVKSEETPQADKVQGPKAAEGREKRGGRRRGKGLSPKGKTT